MRFLAPLVQALGVLLAVSLVTFAAQAGLPGDAAEIRIGPRPELSQVQREQAVAEARKVLGLDQPYPVQYMKWLTHAAQGDFGADLSGDDVRAVVMSRLGASLELAMASLVLSFVLAVFFALRISQKGKRGWARLMNGAIIGGYVIPPFYVGVLLVLAFSVWQPWLPSSGYVPFSEDPVAHIRHLVLPTITLALSQLALYYRYLQQSLREALSSQFIRTARAKGLSERRILHRHALPNALLPVITILGIQIGALIGGVVVVERVFGWPGVGSLLLYAVGRSDFNIVIFIVLAVAAVYVLVSAFIDIAYRLLDPRIRRA